MMKDKSIILMLRLCDQDVDFEQFIDYVNFVYMVWRGKENEVKRNLMVVSRNIFKQKL